MLTSDELKQVARMREGDLEEVPFAVLLHAMAVTERNAVLEIKRRQLCKEIVLEDGVPVDCRSNLVHETLSRFMVSIGRIDEETLNHCFSESCARQVTFGDVLIEKGIIQAEELIKILQQNLARKLLDGFTWREGSFRLHSDFPDVFSPLKVNVAQLIVLGVTRFATQQQIDAAIVPLIGRPLALHPEPHYPLDEITLSPSQRNLVNALRTRHQRIDELAQTTKIEFDDLNRLLYALTLTGVVLRADQIPMSPKRPVRKTAAPPAIVTNEVAAAGPAVTPKMRQELMELVLNYRRKDPFELLGLTLDATSADIQHRFIEFAEKYAPWKYDPGLADRARDLFLAGARAYSELMDPERRRVQVEARRQPLKQASQEAARDQFRIRTALLDPEIQFRRGKTLMNAGEYEKAIIQLEYAADLDSQNSAYRAELAFCRFLSAPTTGAILALEELKETLRIDPRCGLAMYYAGEILRQRGSFEEAERFFQRAIKPMAGDRRPIEALRAMQGERKRRR